MGSGGPGGGGVTPDSMWGGGLLRIVWGRGGGGGGLLRIVWGRVGRGGGVTPDSMGLGGGGLLWIVWGRVDQGGGGGYSG